VLNDTIEYYVVKSVSIAYFFQFILKMHTLDIARSFSISVKSNLFP